MSIMRWNVAGAPCSPKGRVRVLPMSTGVVEGGLGFGSFREWHLPVPFCEVKCGDVLGPTEAIQELIHPRHWVAVELRDFVEVAEVIAEAEGAIWFWYHDDRAGPRAVRWFNHPLTSAFVGFPQ